MSSISDPQLCLATLTSGPKVFVDLSDGQGTRRSEVGLQGFAAAVNSPDQVDLVMAHLASAKIEGAGQAWVFAYQVAEGEEEGVAGRFFEENKVPVGTGEKILGTYFNIR